jgi:2-oxoglutarate ferredoxin oxidoreductase subunit alpha
LKDEITIAFVGTGGDGAVAAGDIIAAACAADGLHVIKTEAYGPQIRGGESSATVRISAKPIHAPADLVDVLLVFNWADFGLFADEITLAEDAVVLHPNSDGVPPAILSGQRTFIQVPFDQLAKDANAPKSKNIIAVGAAVRLASLPQGAVRAAITTRFAKKATAVIEANLRAFDRGLLVDVTPRSFSYTAGEPRLIMSGNDACALATVEAGCRFFAGYPITPSTEVLQHLGEWLPRLGGTALQTEDELSAIGAVIGASFAGKKAMTATSGPGLSLMAEMLGLSSIAEIPCVIYNVQRGGPSTGVPTKSEQSDLFHALYASHGDTPRVVIACADVEETFHATVDAFNIAEEFQLPVVLLTDQSIAQRKQTVDESSLKHEVVNRRVAADLTDYHRYAQTEDGVSPTTVPGMAGGMYQTNGLEHDESGRPSAMYATHARMNDKRHRKLEAVGKKYRMFRRFGDSKPDIGILAWGSSAGAVQEAIDQLKAEGTRCGAFVPQMLMPLPVAEMQTFVDSCHELLVIELSHSGQFHQYLRAQLDLPRHRTRLYARSGGKTLSVSEVMREVRLLAVERINMEVVA